VAEPKKFTNRLIHEKSPYLLQHAHNPVTWFPWGEEAFAAARAQNKPIFLSIGYATCHWCHVMEKECFENEEVAELMNAYFISIKIDREERPDIDSLYMEFAQHLMTGSPGWPLNLLLTPTLHPFFAATYMPPYTNQHLLGMVDLIEKIHKIWDSEERESLIERGDKIVSLIKSDVHTQGSQIPKKEKIENHAEILFQLADPVYGGLHGAPKFPIGYQWNFLIHESLRYRDPRSLFLTERTLEMMHKGGIYDHIGGGFSRYSVDERWIVPHFEKMLYDNAILASLYLEGWKVANKGLYRYVCTDILNYIIRDMTDKNGGFYSAEDADSEGEEGLFYTWKYDEVYKILGDNEETGYFCEYYQITKEGNFDGRNILHTPEDLQTFASKKNKDPQWLGNLLTKQKQQLFLAREQRVHPFKDDKIISSWNGLMIFSMAEAGAAFENQTFIDAAVKAALFIKENMYKNNRLQRRWREGSSQFMAGLDEYACLIRGLITLFEIGEGTDMLSWAIEMTKTLYEDFKSEDGAFYQTDGLDESVLIRKCTFQDGAEPSGNAIHCENLLRLYRLTGESHYLAQAEDILKAVSPYIDSYSIGYCYHMLNLIRYYQQKPVRVVVALNQSQDLKKLLRGHLFQKLQLFRYVIFAGMNDDTLADLIPSLKNQIPVEGKTTLYICQGETCLEPITDPEKMVQELCAARTD